MLEVRTFDKKEYCLTHLQAEGSSSDSEYSEDEFKPVSSHNFGTPGTKQATVRWFKETQTQQVYDPVNVSGNFIAEWFHGVISRRYIEFYLNYEA